MPEQTTQHKRLVLNLFEMNCVSHITHRPWRLPGNERNRYRDLGYWTKLARILEDGGFDAALIADVVVAYDVFRGGPADALCEGTTPCIRPWCPASSTPARAASSPTGSR